LRSSLATFGGTSRNDQTLAHFTNNGFSANSAEVLAFIETHCCPRATRDGQKKIG
jgi:hypothetical protein